MEFMNELLKEIRVKFIVTFHSDQFWDCFDDESYFELERQIMVMLQSIKLFRTYELLDEDFRNYGCESPFHLKRK